MLSTPVPAALHPHLLVVCNSFSLLCLPFLLPPSPPLPHILIPPHPPTARAVLHRMGLEEHENRRLGVTCVLDGFKVCQRGLLLFPRCDEFPVLGSIAPRRHLLPVHQHRRDLLQQRHRRLRDLRGELCTWHLQPLYKDCGHLRNLHARLFWVFVRVDSVHIHLEQRRFVVPVKLPLQSPRVAALPGWNCYFRRERRGLYAMLVPCRIVQDRRMCGELHQSKCQLH